MVLKISLPFIATCEGGDKKQNLEKKINFFQRLL